MSVTGLKTAGPAVSGGSGLIVLRTYISEERCAAHCVRRRIGDAGRTADPSTPLRSAQDDTFLATTFSLGALKMARGCPAAEASTGGERRHAVETDMAQGSPRLFERVHAQIGDAKKTSGVIGIVGIESDPD